MQNKIKKKMRTAYMSHVIHKSKLFDADYYLKQNKDVADFGMKPLRHFILHGAMEGRNPSEKFDVAYYLRRYPDVRESGINPLFHYIRFGKDEGRQAKPSFSPMPVESHLTSSVISACDSAALIFDHSFGGGAQKYISNYIFSNRETMPKVLVTRYVPNNRSYNINVHTNTRVTDRVAYVKADTFFEDLNKIKYSKIIINNLFSWPSVKKVLTWIASYKTANPSVCVEFKGHDYFSICPSFTLQDYNHRFCGIRADEAECNDCVKRLGNQHTFLDEDNEAVFSVSNWRKMWHTFFVNTVDSFEVFSPSSSEIFLKAYPDVAPKLKLIPHKISSFDCCNVAILGHASIYKGSEVVRELCTYLDENQIEDMQLYLFGLNVEGISSTHLKEMGEYERHALPELLKKNKIDLVFIPSTCPETFCYTAGESIALGYPTACFDLGGQADQVRASENGIILYSDEPDYLYTALKSACPSTVESENETESEQKTSAAQTLTRTVVLQDKTSRDFLKWMYQQRDDKSNYVAEAKDSIKMNATMPKVIAFYLPQFHDFPENVNWFGRGFSEWSNTSQTLPQFIGHRQPQVPIDVGYYNLETNNVMHRQAELAKKYGIYGFSVYYYWFSGKKLMEQPLQRLLKDKDLDFPFFLFWANEHWTRLWGNGADREILYKMELLQDDAEKFMEDALPYMKDPRYIKIDNKPVLNIYKLKLVPKKDFIQFVTSIRNIAKKNGFDGVYVTSIIDEWMDTSNLDAIQKEYTLDALIEFSSIFGRTGLNLKKENFLDPACSSYCYDVDDYVHNRKYLRQTKANVFAGLFPNWDNSPRRYNRSASILQSNPENYKMWLSDLIQWTKACHKPNEQFIFVNAWNEWAEGAHLEPDTYYGYAYLQKTREALEESEQNQKDF